MTGRVARTGLGLLFLTLTVAEVGATPTRWQSSNASPLIIGWEQFFRVQWSVGHVSRQRVVEGYITNTWGFPATGLQLLVSGYDASGRKLGQLVAWGPAEIDPGSRVYFDVPVPPATSYGVAIYSWNWTQTGGPTRGRWRH